MLPSPGVPNSADPSSPRWDAFYHACLGGLLLAAGAMLVWRPIYGGLDFWAHAAVGRWCWQNGQVPDRTLFLWTADEPWVYHHWLSQVIFYGLTNVGSPHDLAYVVLAFTTVMVLLPFVLVWLVCRWHGRLSCWMAVPFMVALKGCARRFEARPELFTELSLCLLLMFLVGWSRAVGPGRPDQVSGRDKLGLGAIFFLFVAWANLHGAVVIGLLILAVTAGCDLVQDRFSRRSRVLAFFTLLAPVAVCVNPYGLSYWQAFRQVTSFTFAHILEWLPVWEPPALPEEWVIAAVVLLALALVAWVMNPSRRLAHLAWLVLLGLLFLRARRNVWPYILVCLIVLAANAQALDPELLIKKVSRYFSQTARTTPRSLASIMRWPVRAGVLVWVGFECLLLWVTLAPDRPLLPTNLEQGLGRFIREHQLKGRIFNDYYNASYLQWLLAGHPPLYIDSLNAYPDNVARAYAEIMSVTPRGRQLLDEQHIAIVILTVEPASVPLLVALADDLDANSRWVRVYAGKDGVIWVRRTLEYKHLWGTPHGSVSQVRFRDLSWGG